MKVSWDHYSQYMENKSHVPNPQPDSVPTLISGHIRPGFGFPTGWVDLRPRAAMTG